MIAIIDYGMGNLRSVSKAFEAVGHKAVVTRDTRVIGNASHVVLPGVGAFGDCMANVERYGLAKQFAQRFNRENHFWESVWGFNCCLRKVRNLGLIRVSA